MGAYRWEARRQSLVEWKGRLIPGRGHSGPCSKGRGGDTPLLLLLSHHGHHHLLHLHLHLHHLSHLVAIITSHRLLLLQQLQLFVGPLQISKAVCLIAIRCIIMLLCLRLLWRLLLSKTSICPAACLLPVTGGGHSLVQWGEVQVLGCRLGGCLWGLSREARRRLPYPSDGLTRLLRKTLSVEFTALGVLRMQWVPRLSL